MDDLEHEQFLEEALEDMEFGGNLTDDQVACIRQACGKSKPKINAPESFTRLELITLFEDFGKVFGGVK